jgi:hypothetical protein
MIAHVCTEENAKKVGIGIFVIVNTQAFLGLLVGMVIPPF